MNSEQFVTTLKQLVRRTIPRPSGYWERYLEQEEPSLEAFVASQCQAFLEGDEMRRQEIERSMCCDEDVLWFFSRFIHTQVSAMKEPSDLNALVLGVAAVAIIGPVSDPRDITFWLGDVYLAAVVASIPDATAPFARIGGLATLENRVSDQITHFPERNEKVTQSQAERMRRMGQSSDKK